MSKLGYLNSLNLQELFDLFCEHFYGTDHEPNREYLIECLLTLQPKTLFS